MASVIHRIMQQEREKVAKLTSELLAPLSWDVDDLTEDEDSSPLEDDELDEEEYEGNVPPYG